MSGKSAVWSHATLAALSALAFIAACVAHEAVGHGGMCLLVGARVTLLTSVYFSCSAGGAYADAAGPLMNLALGFALCLVLRWRSFQSIHARLLVVFAMAFNLFWGAGYFLFSAVVNSGDWAFALQQVAPDRQWIARVAMGAFGIYLYARSTRLVAVQLPSRTPLLEPYLAAGIVACMSVLFFHGPVVPALREAVDESFLAAVGLPPIAWRRRARGEEPADIVTIDGSGGWIAVAVLACAAFFATMGRGIAGA